MREYSLDVYRKKGIATNIIIELEKAALQKGANTIGIGVGLFKDYGSAQRLYTKLGYIPDGNGIQYDGKPVQKGTYVFVDDDLVLYYTKKLV
ncbi:GNAT family N-acetyltransferase [Margalitia sp. FSL K6-0131]|uniref:GNAT family N-acetyltransferase n=1 Tax=Margalitia sp. FSL K6-0131 TaxID=2954604 RepID=UPI0030FC8B7B